MSKSEIAKLLGCDEDRISDALPGRIEGCVMGLEYSGYTHERAIEVVFNHIKIGIEFIEEAP